MKNIADFVAGPWQEFKNGRIVALTGAGISEESGISTFRGSDGLWAKYNPQLFASPEGLLGVLRDEPGKMVGFLDELYSAMLKARPNRAHRAFCELEKQGRLSSVITQNIDNLHQDAGSQNVLELHGNAFRLRCDGCGRLKTLEKEKMAGIIEELKKTEGRRSGVLKVFSKFFPRCACQGRLRIDVVLFGELLDSRILDEAYAELDNCSLMIIAGTSGAVYPAASLPYYAKERGARLLEINTSPSSLSVICDYQLMGRAGEVLPKLL
ncbi:MAG: SIR2 family NAD-dependent protein deacylase [Candidatus Omnitrophota bacterium]